MLGERVHCEEIKHEMMKNSTQLVCIMTECLRSSLICHQLTPFSRSPQLEI